MPIDREIESRLGRSHMQEWRRRASRAGGIVMLSFATCVGGRVALDTSNQPLTALFIRAGAVGGMIFPALSTGVAIGEFVAVAVNHLGGAVSEPTLALIAGAAVRAITQHAPLFAAAFAVELTRPPLEVCVMLLFAAVGAHVVHTAVTRRRAADRTPAEH